MDIFGEPLFLPITVGWTFPKLCSFPTQVKLYSALYNSLQNKLLPMNVSCVSGGRFITAESLTLLHCDKTPATEALNY